MASLLVCVFVGLMALKLPLQCVVYLSFVWGTQLCNYLNLDVACVCETPFDTIKQMFQKWLVIIIK